MPKKNKQFYGPYFKSMKGIKGIERLVKIKKDIENIISAIKDTDNVRFFYSFSNDAKFTADFSKLSMLDEDIKQQCIKFQNKLISHYN